MMRCDVGDEFFPDICQVNNGGCGANAACSFDDDANTIKCTCKTGYSNTGVGSTVICTGDNSHLELIVSIQFSYVDIR